MQAHGGQLVILPTMSDDLTEVKLVFPVKDTGSLGIDPDPYGWSS
jgi:hypothetical protein